jgi:PGF-pre-PGF domain-containing protein
MVKGRITLVGSGVVGEIVRVFITDENLSGKPSLAATAVVDQDGKWSAPISLVPNHLLKIEVAFVDNVGNESEKVFFGYIIFLSRALQEKPEEVPKPRGTVYRYVELSIPFPENAEVEFKVPKSWLEETNIDSKTVRLARYDNRWIELPTTQHKEDNSFAYYRAPVQTSSTFAIIGEEMTFPFFEILALVLIAGGAISYVFFSRLKRD